MRCGVMLLKALEEYDAAEKLDGAILKVRFPTPVACLEFKCINLIVHLFTSDTKRLLRNYKVITKTRSCRESSECS